MTVKWSMLIIWLWMIEWMIVKWSMLIMDSYGWSWMIEWMIVAGAVPRGLCVKAHFSVFCLGWGGVGWGMLTFACTCVMTLMLRDGWGGVGWGMLTVACTCLMTLMLRDGWGVMLTFTCSCPCVSSALPVSASFGYLILIIIIIIIIMFIIFARMINDVFYIHASIINSTPLSSSSLSGVLGMYVNVDSPGTIGPLSLSWTSSYI